MTTIQMLGTNFHRTTKSQVTNSLKILSRFSGREYAVTFASVNTLYEVNNRNVERYIISGTKTELYTYIHFAIDIVSRMDLKTLILDKSYRYPS